ncbi:MAG TPA: alpha/beta hydrolase [Puia sp.]|jgi:pimeloyl-ACP methyl ester carboxylesterase|nr:alpha/beta hydrolase [Puia sp.]
MRARQIAILFILGCCACRQPQAPDPVAYGDNPAAGHYVNTRGMRLYYETYGEGEPLLMLHINGGSIQNFFNQIPWFAARYHVIAVDTRAHGKSVDPGDSLTFEQMADDFNALLDSLHLDSCNVIGWSDGGISGLQLAIRHPEKVKKLVVSGPNIYPDTTGLVPFIFHYLERVADTLKQKPQTPEVKNQLKIIELDLKEPHMTPEQLQEIHCPTLVMGGDHDGIPSYHLWLISQHIPQSYLWIVPNSGHSVAIYKKDQFNAVVGDFLAQPYRKIEGLDVLH